MAADIKKPDGLTVVRFEEAEHFLSPLPIGRLVGVGAKTGEKMQALGILTVGDLAKCDTQKLIEVFGKNLGTYFHNASLGIDYQPVQERGEAESISRISTLKQDTRELPIILDRVNQLCDEIYDEATQRGLDFRSVGIVVVMTDLSVRSRSKTFENPTNESELLKITVRELFEKFLAESELGIRRVGVKISNFVKKTETQKQITSFLEPAGK
jgi:nucleotidyltransferase/DNA polymerase involved in DNA repair